MPQGKGHHFLKLSFDSHFFLKYCIIFFMNLTDKMLHL